MITVKLTAEQIESIKEILTFNFNEVEKTMTQLMEQKPEHAEHISRGIANMKQDYLDQIQAFDDAYSDAYTDAKSRDDEWTQVERPSDTELYDLDGDDFTYAEQFGDAPDYPDYN